MTKLRKEEKKLEPLKEENKTLKQQIAILSDLQNLKDTEYYRQQKLIMLQRQTKATERMALALENSLEESSEEEPAEEDEEEDLDAGLEDDE